MIKTCIDRILANNLCGNFVFFCALNTTKMKLMMFCDQSLRDGKGCVGMDNTVVETVFDIIHKNYIYPSCYSHDSIT